MPAGDEDAGTSTAYGASYPKRRSVRMLYEMSEEEAMARAITFLEDALGYRLVGGTVHWSGAPDRCRGT